MPDVSWSLFVVWHVCLMCQIWQLREFAMYCLYYVILHLLIFLELLTSPFAYFVISFSVWQFHHYRFNDHQDELQYCCCSNGTRWRSYLIIALASQCHSCTRHFLSCKCLLGGGVTCLTNKAKGIIRESISLVVCSSYTCSKVKPWQKT
jgi:hypothetical protein